MLFGISSNDTFSLIFFSMSKISISQSILRMISSAVNPSMKIDRLEMIEMILLAGWTHFGQHCCQFCLPIHWKLSRTLLNLMVNWVDGDFYWTSKHSSTTVFSLILQSVELNTAIFLKSEPKLVLSHVYKK